MCGLDMTHQALATEANLDRLRALGTPLADLVVGCSRFFAHRYRDIWGLPAPPLHDPVAVARVIDPALVRCEDAQRGGRATRSPHARGHGLRSFRRARPSTRMRKVALELDGQELLGTGLAAVDRLGART